MLGNPIPPAPNLDKRRQQHAFQVLSALISTRENTPIPEEKLDGYIKQAILITDKMIEELDK